MYSTVQMFATRIDSHVISDIRITVVKRSSLAMTCTVNAYLMYVCTQTKGQICSLYHAHVHA